MQLFNTQGRKKEKFIPVKEGTAIIYSCGPTVYDYQHIGNYSGYIYWDVMVRILKFQGLDVKRIINITDVGHLVSDADEGEDKLEKGARREGLTARAVADFYTRDFKKNVRALNLLVPDAYPNATDFIEQQQDIIKTLIDKGFAYPTSQAIYFDVSKLGDYGKLTGQKLADKEVGSRSEVVTDEQKHHPQDFALWFFTVGRFKDHELHWGSPWGVGFPGWHIECSAIIHTLLGEPIDIHTGGIDHIGTHHTNEIAQTEAAFGHELTHYWLHNNHMMVDGQKISKSLGNGLTLQDLAEQGFSAMDFKMLVLQSHYRSQSNFSWENLESAKNRLVGYRNLADRRWQATNNGVTGTEITEFQNKFLTRLEDDLDTPKALAVFSEFSDGITANGLSSKAVEAFREFIKVVDTTLGLDLSSSTDISDSLKQMIKTREDARKNKDWKSSDEIRDQLTEKGIELKDTEDHTYWSRSPV